MAALQSSPELCAVSMMAKNEMRKHHLLDRSKLSVTRSELDLTGREYRYLLRGDAVSCLRFLVNPIFRGALSTSVGSMFVTALSSTGRRPPLVAFWFVLRGNGLPEQAPPVYWVLMFEIPFNFKLWTTGCNSRPAVAISRMASATISGLTVGFRRRRISRLTPKPRSFKG